MKSVNRPLAEHLPSEVELGVLTERWEQGQLMPRIEPLLSFAVHHREEILRRLGRKKDHASLIPVIQGMILETGSVHLASELKDQIREIRSEIWYQGEKGPHEPKRIQEAWTQNHAQAWRTWRLKEYLFVTERSAELLAARLKHPESGV